MTYDKPLIACMLVTHLPVKAEVRRYTQLRGKPVIIIESYGSKDLVLDSSAEAKLSLIHI